MVPRMETMHGTMRRMVPCMVLHARMEFHACMENHAVFPIFSDSVGMIGFRGHCRVIAGVIAGVIAEITLVGLIGFSGNDWIQWE